MATTNKSEKIFIGQDDQVIELTGADKEAFIADRAETQKQIDAEKLKQATELELKKSAFAKLGLTAEEIKAIL
jgi:hypothetical protein